MLKVDSAEGLTALTVDSALVDRAAGNASYLHCC